MWNSPRRDIGNVMELREDKERKTEFRHIRKLKYEKDKVIEVDLTGACCLFSKRASNANYSNNKQGEDVSFALDAKKKQIRMFCCLEHLAEHIMDRNIPIPIFAQTWRTE